MIQRCYIAGRISGIPRDVMEMYFAQAETEVKKLGFEPINILKSFLGLETPISERVYKIVTSNIIYVLKGFGDQYDERIEFGLIQSLSILIIYQK
jgi:hypothetical protein